MVASGRDRRGWVELEFRLSEVSSFLAGGYGFGLQQVKTQCRVHFVAVGLQTTLKFVLGAFLGMIWSFTRIFVPR